MLYQYYLRYKKDKTSFLSRPKHVLEHRLRRGKLKLGKHLDVLYGRPRMRAETLAISMQYKTPSHIKAEMMRTSADLGDGGVISSGHYFDSPKIKRLPVINSPEAKLSIRNKRQLFQNELAYIKRGGSVA